MDWHVIRKKKKRGGGETLWGGQTGSTLVTIGVVLLCLIGFCGAQDLGPNPPPDEGVLTAIDDGSGDFDPDDNGSGGDLLPTGPADPIAQAGNTDGHNYHQVSAYNPYNSGYYPYSGYYPPYSGNYPHEGGYYGSGGGYYGSGGGGYHGSGYYPTHGGYGPHDDDDHHDDDDDFEDELADSLTSIAEAIVMLSKVHPNSLKDFHPSKCQDGYNPPHDNNNMPGYNDDDDGDDDHMPYSGQSDGTEYEMIPYGPYSYDFNEGGGAFGVNGEGFYSVMGSGYFTFKGEPGSQNFYIYAETFDYLNCSIEVSGTFTYNSTAPEYVSRTNDPNVWRFQKYNFSSTTDRFELKVEDGWYNITVYGKVFSASQGSGEYGIQGALLDYYTISGSNAQEGSYRLVYTDDDDSSKYDNYYEYSSDGGYKIWGQGGYATGNWGPYSHQGSGRCNISALGSFAVMVYGTFNYTDATGEVAIGVGQNLERYGQDSWFILNVTDGWYHVSGDGGADATGTGDYFIQANGSYWVYGSGGFDNSTTWEGSDDDKDDVDDDNYLMVNPEFYLQSDDGGFNITGMGTYNCSGSGMLILFGSGHVQIHGYGNYIVEANASCSLEDNNMTIFQDTDGLCYSSNGWGYFNLTTTGGFYNVTILDGGVNLCVAEYGYYNVSAMGSIAIQGTGADENSMAWTNNMIEFDDHPPYEDWEHIEVDSTDIYYVQISKGGVYAMGNGGINCAYGEGTFHHEGDGMFSTEGYGKFLMEGNGSYVIRTDWFGEQQGFSTSDDFQVYGESGNYFVNISYGHYKIITSGYKYSCHGLSMTGYSLYAQGQIDIWGDGLQGDSGMYKIDDDNGDDDDDDDDDKDKDEMETSTVEFEGSFQLNVEMGGYYIEGWGSYEKGYSTGNFSYFGYSNFNITAYEVKWFHVYAEQPCDLQWGGSIIGTTSSEPCEHSGEGWFTLNAMGSMYNVTVTHGTIKNARSGPEYYMIKAEGMYSASGSGAYGNSRAWDHKTTVLTSEEDRSEVTTIYDNFDIVSYGEMGFEIHGEYGYFDCQQGEGFFGFKSDYGNLNISGYGKYMVQGSGDIKDNYQKYGWSEVYGQSYTIADYGDYSFNLKNGNFYVATWGTMYQCNAEVWNSMYSLFGVGEYRVTGYGADPDRSLYWTVEEDDDKGPPDDHYEMVTSYYQVSEMYNLYVYNGGYTVNGYGTYGVHGEGNFTFAGSSSTVNISGHGYYYVKAMYPCKLTTDLFPNSYDWSSEAYCEDSGYGSFELAASGNSYNVSVMYGSEVKASLEYFSQYYLTGSGMFKLHGTGAYSEQSMFWDNKSKMITYDGRDNVKMVPETFELEPPDMGGYEIYGNYGEFSCEKGEGFFKFAGDGSFSTYGYGKYIINGSGSYSADTSDHGYIASAGSWQYVGNGSYSFNIYSGYYNLTVWGRNEHCEGQSWTMYWLYGLGEYDIKGWGADSYKSKHWRLGDPYPGDDDDDDDDDDDVDWKDSDICELSEDEQWAAYHLINNQKDTIRQLLEYFSGLAEETFEDMCSDDHDKPQDQMWACSIIKAFMKPKDGDDDDDDDRPSKCSVFDIMGVLMHPDSYLSLLDESVESCSADNPDMSVSDNEYCKSVMLQEDVARTFGALLKTIDEDGFSTILFDDNLVCPSEENQNYCNYKKYLERALHVGEITSFTNDDIGDFFEFLFDIAAGNEECPNYFRELCDSEWYGPFKTVVKLADGLFSLLEDFIDDGEPEDPYMYRRQAPTTVEQKSNVVMFFEKLEDLLNIVSEGGAVMQVLSSVEMLGILGDYDDARTFCAEYPYWYNYRMCTLDNIEVQNSIFGLLDTVWNRNNAMMLSAVTDMMTDYNSIRFLVDNEYEMSDDQICPMVDSNWHDANGDPIPNTIQELCNDDQRNSVASASAIVRTMGKSVSAMGPMFCPAFSDLEWLDPYLKDSFNESMVEVVRDVLNREMQCMSDNLDITDLFDIDKLLDDHELKEFVCGNNGSNSGNSGHLYGKDDDDDDDDSFEMITRLVIIALLVIILIVLIMVLYIQFRIIRQMSNQSKSSHQEAPPPGSHLSTNLADNHPGGHVSNIEKRLTVPPASASSTRSVSQVDANDRTRLMKQPPNLPPPPPTFTGSVVNDMNKSEDKKKPRTTQYNVNPANFGFYSPNAASMAPQPPTYPQQPGQVNYGFYGDGTAGALPPTAPDFKQTQGSNSESGISTESRTGTPDSAMPDVEGSER